MNSNGNMYYFVENIQGDITKIIDENGTVVANYAYDAWGKILNETEDTSIKGIKPIPLSWLCI